MWTRCGRIIEDLGKDGMSSDETDTDDVHQAVASTIPTWRRRTLGAVMHSVDLEATSQKKATAHACGKTYHPQMLRKRGRRMNTHTAAPKGVARQYFHRTHLNHLRPDQIDDLDIDDEKVDDPFFAHDWFRDDSDDDSDMAQDDW